MYSKLPFPISTENLPRHKSSFCCLSLKFGAVFTALAVLLSSIYGLAAVGAALGKLPETDADESNIILTAIVIGTTNNVITFILTALLLIGVLRESLRLMKPWLIWTSAQLMVFVVMFIYMTTVNTVHNSGDGSLVLYVLQFLILVIRIYMLILVASYYRQLEEDKDESMRLRKLVDHEMWYTA